MKKIIYIFLGSVFVLLAILGVYLPLLPTTPFLLLASWFYIRSSKTLYDKLLNSKLLGSYLRNYIENDGMEKKHKIISISTLWIGLVFSSIQIMNIALAYILFTIGYFVTAHILHIKTVD